MVAGCGEQKRTASILGAPNNIPYADQFGRVYFQVQF
jgi:hypothetical protein